MRSVSQILSQLDMMGLILAEVKSLGKHGLTKIIRVKDDVINVVKKVLADV